MYLITFDPVTGAATLDRTGGTVIGSRGLGIRISARGNFLALGYGSSRASLSIDQINTANFALTPVGTEDLGDEMSATGTDQMFPSSIFFDPTGQITYVQVPLAGASNCSHCFELLDTSTFLVLPSPMPVTNANFLSGLQNPQAPFTYVVRPIIFSKSTYMKLTREPGCPVSRPRSASRFSRSLRRSFP